MIKLIADCGLPLKISTEWTEDEYTSEDMDDLIHPTQVKGYRVSINDTIYPRGHTNGDGSADWSYRYTPPAGHTAVGRRVAITNALLEAGLKVKGLETKWRMT